MGFPLVFLSEDIFDVDQVGRQNKQWNNKQHYQLMSTCLMVIIGTPCKLFQKNSFFDKL